MGMSLDESVHRIICSMLAGICQLRESTISQHPENNEPSTFKHLTHIPGFLC